MTVIEILLLIAGAVIFALGFFLPGSSNSISTDKEKSVFQDELKQMSDAQLKDATRRVRDMIDEEVSMVGDTSSRAMEKITNEKIMAINEYGKTVTDEIERNHQEVVFMYDMLNDKTTDIKNTIRKYESMEKSMQKTAAEAQITPKPRTKDNIHIPRMFAPGVTAYSEEIAGSTSSADTPQASYDPPQTESRETASYGNNDIINLHNSGMSDVDIARELKIGVGEVKLAISLNGGGGNES